MCTFAFMMIYLRPSTNVVIDNAMFVLLLAINSLFWVRFIYSFGKIYFVMLKDMWQKFKNRLKKKPEEGEDSIEKDEVGDKSKEENANVVPVVIKKPLWRKDNPLKQSKFTNIGEMSRENSSPPLARRGEDDLVGKKKTYTAGENEYRR